MIVYDVLQNSVDVSVVIRIIDSTDGTPETGVVFNTSGIDLEYRREGAASTDITEATLAALTTAHTDGGFLHIGNGYYRLDLPDAAVASGASGCLVHGTVTGMVVIGCYIRIIDPAVARFGVNVVNFGGAAGTFASGRPEVNTTHFGGSALTQSGGRPEVNASHIGGSAISQSGGVANVNATQISGDSTAADNLETAYDDTAGPVPWEGILDQGTAQAATGTTIQLRSAATFADDTLIGCWVMAFGSTQGYWQVRQITAYVSSTDTATVDTWTVTPSGTITYKVLAAPPWPATPPNVNVAQISGDSTAADNAEAFFDGTGYAGTGNTIPTVTTVTNLTNAPTNGDLTATMKASVNAEVDSALDTAVPGSPTANSINERIKTMDDADMPGSLSTLLARITSSLFSGITSLAQWLGALAGKQTANSTARTEIRATGAGSGTYDETTESLEAIRDRGDAAWTTGGGGSLSDILQVIPAIPNALDLADTATVRIGLMLINTLDDLPTTGEITPGTISIHRKAIGGTSWSAILTDQACSEQAGMVYFDEVFDAGTGYAAGDSIRITFKSQKITVAANDYEITDSNGVMFYTFIREAERGTNGANTTTPPTAAAIRTEMDSNSTKLAAIEGDTNELQTDWANGGRLDLLIDAILDDTGTAGVVISAATANQIADAILKRDWTSVSGEAARSVLNALRAIRNKFGFPGGVYTVYKEDDSTTAWTGTPTTDPSAEPITSIDPA